LDLVDVSMPKFCFWVNFYAILYGLIVQVFEKFQSLYGKTAYGSLDDWI